MRDVIDFIANLEGFSSVPYWDYKQWSIGYGYACGYDPKVKPNIIETKEEGKRKLASRLEADKTNVTKILKIPFTTGLIKALLSFNYNLGIGNTIKIAERLNAGESFLSVARTWVKYHYAGGKPNSHLKARRLLECKQFLSPLDYSQLQNEVKSIV